MRQHPVAMGLDVRPRVRRARSEAAVLALAALLLLGGCTSVVGGTGELIVQAATQHRARLPSAAAVAANHNYQLYMQTPAGQGVLILGNLDGDREAWYGPDHVVVFLRNGQVVRTAGLTQNLEGLHETANNPFARGLQHLAAPLTWTRVEDWSGYRYGVPVTVTLEPVRTTTLSILGASHTVLEIQETLDASSAHWHAVNHYWVDVHDGLVWKSIQQIAPGETLTLLQLQPYRGARP